MNMELMIIVVATSLTPSAIDNDLSWLSKKATIPMLIAKTINPQRVPERRYALRLTIAKSAG
jgi:hypothetical protein